jgi:hypothetical protein
MEQYRVVTLSISGKGKKIYRLGEKVTQSNVTASIEDLLATGAILTEADWVSRETRIAEEERKRQANPVAFVLGFGQSTMMPTVVSDAKAPATSTATPTATDTGGDGKGPKEVATDEIRSVDEYTKNEIMAELDGLEVDYKSSESKEALYNLLVKAKSLNA